MSLLKIHEEIIDKLNNKDQNAYNLFIFMSHNIMIQYIENLKKPQIRSFMKRVKVEDSSLQDILIKQYINILQIPIINNNIINIESLINSLIYKPKINHIECNNCKNTELEETETDQLLCNLCFSLQSKYSIISSHEDIERINISYKYVYERKNHFKDCIQQYQSKQKAIIDIDLIKNIERLLSNNYLLDPGTTRKEIYKRVTKEHILYVLKELKQSSHYENVHLIHKNITDQPPNDISFIEIKLLNDFDLFSEIYDKRNNKEKKNFVNCNFLLYQLLQNNSIPCKKSEFYILKSSDRKDNNLEVIKPIFDELNWNCSN